MPAKKNPLKLNPLQLRTLAVLQELARHSATSTRTETGNVVISNFPHAHGDHIHLGSRVVLARDATGLGNPAVWTALERKGLAFGDFPLAIALTPVGLDYDTGVADAILHGATD